jgi:hypothetical protein
LAAGSYIVSFHDQGLCGGNAVPGDYVTQWYNHKSDRNTATPVKVTVGKTTTGINAALVLGGSISGKVTGAGTAPLKGICVGAQKAGTSGGSPLPNASTAATGTYTLRGLPAGTYDVSFKSTGFCPNGTAGNYVTQWYNHESDQNTATPVKVTVGKTTTGINAALVVGGSISGRVTRAGSTPLAGVCVGAFPVGSSSYVAFAVTANDGTYSIPALMAGSYDVEFLPTGFGGYCHAGNYVTQWWNDKTAQWTATAVTVTASKTTTTIDATMALAGAISGTVTSAATGKPIADICVGATGTVHGTPAGAGAVTGSTGKYMLTGLPAGNYKVSFTIGRLCNGPTSGNYATQWYHGVATESAAGTVKVTAGKTTTTIDAAMLAGGTIKGIVTTKAHGHGLQRLCVEAVPVTSTKPVDFVTTNGTNGSYVLTGLAAGRYDVEFQTATSYKPGSCGPSEFVTQWYDGKLTQGAAQAVTVTNGSTQGTVDAVMLPAVPPAPSTTTGHSSASSDTQTAIAEAKTTTSGVDATATGVGAITVAKYVTNPTSTKPSTGSGEFFDVKISTSNSFASLAITDCDLDGGDALYWWTGTAFKPVSPAAVPGPAGCVTFTATHTTTPSLTALSGTILAVVTAVVPARPTAPNATPGDTEVTVTWTKPTTGGSTITFYTVKSSTGTRTCTWTSTSGPLTCTVTGLTNGKSYTFTVTAHNSVGTSPPSSASNAVVPRSSPLITTSSLPPGTVGTEYSTQLALTGGNAPFKWTVTSGKLPPGLELDATTGAIAGTPTPTFSTAPYTASYDFKITVTDAYTLTSSRTLTIKVMSTGTPLITSTSLPAGTTGTAYSAQLTVEYSNAPYKWAITSGSLPAGLSLNATTGAITGVPTSAATANFAVKVTGGNKLSTTVSLSITVNTPPPPKTAGYDLVGSDGGVFVFPTGSPTGFYGSLPGLGVSVKDIVGMVPTVSDKGYFLVGADGGVFSFGNAPFLGSLPGKGIVPSAPITGIVAADTDKGYFLVGRDGGVFAFGTVPFLGSLPGRGISVDDIIGIAATPSGNGYWVVSATGTVYAFGAAKQLGTAKGTPSPVSAIAGTPTGGGYWITTESGAVYAFGDAKSFGTLPADHVSPAEPVIGVVHTADTGGYWLIGSDGGIFAFGDAGFVGSLPGVNVHVTDIVGAVPTAG